MNTGKTTHQNTMADFYVHVLITLLSKRQICTSL